MRHVVAPTVLLATAFMAVALQGQQYSPAGKHYEVQVVIAGGQVAGMQAGNFPALLIRQHGAMVSTTGPNSGRVTATVQKRDDGNFTVDAVLEKKPAPDTEIAIDFNGNIGGIAASDVEKGFPSDQPVYETLSDWTYDRFKLLLPMAPGRFASTAEFVLPVVLRSLPALAMGPAVAGSVASLSLVSSVAQEKLLSGQPKRSQTEALETQIQDLQRQVNAIKNSLATHPGGMDQ